VQAQLPSELECTEPGLQQWQVHTMMIMIIKQQMMYLFFATVFHFFSTVFHFSTPPSFLAIPPLFFSPLIFFLGAFFTLKPHNPSDSITVVLCCFRIEIDAGGKKMVKKEGDVAKK
jgi:hypothetical protein